MNESAAREVLLVRAVEMADGADATLSAGDRGHAARAAAELVRWQAADQGRQAAAEEFLARRAQLLAAKLTERSPRAFRALRAFQWRPWIGGDGAHRRPWSPGTSPSTSGSPLTGRKPSSSVAWSPAFLDGLGRSALLRYLAVAPRSRRSGRTRA